MLTSCQYLSTTSFLVTFDRPLIPRSSSGGDFVLLAATRRSTNAGNVDEELPDTLVCTVAVASLTNTAADIFSPTGWLGEFSPTGRVIAPATFTYFTSGESLLTPEELERLTPVGEIGA